jgi:ABC-type multidrug transport system ATPase subunit
LTQDAFYGRAFGTVSLNGIPMTERLFKRYCYVVKQQDTSWPYLTARETVTYAAELYDITENKEATELLVNDLIRKTGLMSCADTKVARLSGGQQRRLSLAVGLIKQPAVLFLDEPTSGLDAASASHIMREIKRVAEEEHIIVICTIHQPSTKVYNGFDQVMLLSKGREAFVGNANAASAYFDSIGHTLPPATNPAEHLLDVVNADFSSSEEVDKMLDMLRRYATLVMRDPILYAGRLVGFLIVNCFFGVVYIAARDYTQDQAGSKLWVSVWFIGTLDTCLQLLSSSLL